MTNRISNNLLLGFVDKYNYPPQVKEQFEEIMSFIDSSRVKSVLLTGSTSRGELSYLTTNNRIELYSDYEFLIISNSGVDPSDLLRLVEAYGELEKKYSSNPLFHIDFSYIDIKSLRRTPLQLKHYETKENGITIYGENLKHLLPDITLKNLDFKDLNEVLIWRLWAMLLYMPKNLLAGKDMVGEEEDIYKYVLYRNLLDLTTWGLPSKGVLLPSFKERISHLNTSFSNLQDEFFMDKGFLYLMNESMTGKFKLEFHRNLFNLYTTAIHYFVKAKEYLLIQNGVTWDNSEDGDIILAKKSSKFFHDYHYRRKGYEAQFFLRHYNDLGIKKGLQWIFAGKYGLMLNFLCSIHLALVCRLNDNSDAGYHLDRADSILQRLSTRKIHRIRLNEFEKSWLALRNGFAIFLMDYFRSIKMKQDYINSVLK